MRLVTRLQPLIATPTRLFGVLALWFMALACWRPLAVPDEGRYTDVSRWMLRSGDWVIPRLDGLPFLHKPPLYYWIEASVMGLFGPGLLTARAASLLGLWCTCLVAYVLVRRLSDERSARWGVIALATSPLAVLGGQYANLDMLVAGCISLTLMFAVLACHAESPRQRRMLWWATYAMAGFGVLAKGLIGLVLPGAVFLLWALLDRQPKRILQGLSVVGLLLFAAVVTPWFWVAEQHISGLTHFFIVVQHFQRYTQTGFNNAWGPWYYPAVVAAGMLPWTIAAFWTWRAPADTLASPTQRSLQRLGLVWLAVIMLFFSIPPSKLVGYILPLLPALAMLLGPRLAVWRHRHAVALLGAALCVALAVVAARHQKTDATRLAQALKPHIAQQDLVVCWQRYDYTVPVVLDRASPVLVVDSWSTPSQQLPDNWRRELMEGLEFEPAHRDTLITPAQWAELQRSQAGRTAWIWVDASTAERDPLLQGWPVVKRVGKVVVLRAGRP